AGPRPLRSLIVAISRPSDPGAGEDLLAQIGVGVAEALDEDVRRTVPLLDERGQAGEVDALVLAVLVEPGAPREAARSDVDDARGQVGERRPAERRGEGPLRDGGA